MKMRMTVSSCMMTTRTKPLHGRWNQRGRMLRGRAEVNVCAEKRSARRLQSTGYIEKDNSGKGNIFAREVGCRHEQKR